MACQHGELALGDTYRSGTLSDTVAQKWGVGDNHKRLSVEGNVLPVRIKFLDRPLKSQIVIILPPHKGYK